MKLLRRCASEYADLSDAEISRLASEKYQREHEPKLREEERQLGTSNWETMSWISLLQRSVDRYHESKRPAELREARRHGIPNPENMTTDALHWANLSARVRESNIRNLCS